MNLKRLSSIVKNSHYELEIKGLSLDWRMRDQANVNGMNIMIGILLTPSLRRINSVYMVRKK